VVDLALSVLWSFGYLGFRGGERIQTFIRLQPAEAQRVAPDGTQSVQARGGGQQNTSLPLLPLENQYVNKETDGRFKQLDESPIPISSAVKRRRLRTTMGGS